VLQTNEQENLIPYPFRKPTSKLFAAISSSDGMTPVQSVYEIIQQLKLPDAELHRGPQPHHSRVEPRQSEPLTIAFRAGFNFGFNNV
jgi:hypothetical protein